MKALRYVGKAEWLKAYLLLLINYYGKKAKLEDVIEKRIGANR